MGVTYYHMKKYEEALLHFDKSYSMLNQYNIVDKLYLITYKILLYKKIEKKYNLETLNKLINETDKLEYETDFNLFKIFNNKGYLKRAYKSIKQIISEMEEELKLKFLNYPIPKAIVEEWEKVNK